jgi:hypothetical protein
VKPCHTHTKTTQQKQLPPAPNNPKQTTIEKKKKPKGLLLSATIAKWKPVDKITKPKCSDTDLGNKNQIGTFAHKNFKYCSLFWIWFSSACYSKLHTLFLQLGALR